MVLSLEGSWIISKGIWRGSWKPWERIHGSSVEEQDRLLLRSKTENRETKQNNLKNKLETVSRTVLLIHSITFMYHKFFIIIQNNCTNLYPTKSAIGLIRYMQSWMEMTLSCTLSQDSIQIWTETARLWWAVKQWNLNFIYGPGWRHDILSGWEGYNILI